LLIFEPSAGAVREHVGVRRARRPAAHLGPV